MVKYKIESIEQEFKNLSDASVDTILSQSELYPEFIGVYATLDEAKQALKAYKTEVTSGDKCHIVKIYYIQQIETDKDGDEISGGDIWETTKM